MPVVVDTTLVPPGVVTRRSTTPAACAGLVALTWVAETTVSAVPAVPANVTFVAPVRLVPVTVTTVQPAMGPDFGAIAVTVSAAAAACAD